MTETVQSADGTVIAYERSGSGPALILIGGAFSTRRSAGELASLLAPHFSVYAYDRRGRGDSTDTPPYAVEREVEDLHALVVAAGGSACLYGHSSGAVLAIEATAQGLAVPKLAVYEPPYMIDDTREKPPADYTTRLEGAIRGGHREQAAELFFAEAVGLPAEVIEMMKHSPYWTGMLAVAHTLLYDNAIVGDGSMPTDRLRTIDVPTLAMDGGASPTWARNAVAAVADAVPRAQRHTLEGQEHAAAAAAVVPVLIDFLD